MENWKPDRKVVGGAVAAIVAWAAQYFGGVDLPPGVEGAIGIVAAYLIPSRA